MYVDHVILVALILAILAVWTAIVVFGFCGFHRKICTFKEEQRLRRWDRRLRTENTSLGSINEF
jgi:hypothetical protein